MGYKIGIVALQLPTEALRQGMMEQLFYRAELMDNVEDI